MTLLDPQAALIRAIVTKWGATPSLGVIAGPWNQIAPTSQPNHPYCIMHPDDPNPLGMTCLGSMWECEVEFTIYHKSPTECQTYCSVLNGIFMSDSLISAFPMEDGYSLFRCALSSPRYDKKEEGGNVWSGNMRYKFDTYRARVA